MDFLEWEKQERGKKQLPKSLHIYTISNDEINAEAEILTHHTRNILNS